MHAVIVRGGAIQGEGYNRPVAEFPGKLVNPVVFDACGLHAEMDCIRRTHPDNVEGGIMYISGVSPSGMLLKSRPCSFCIDPLLSSGIKKIVWHDVDGRAHFLRINSLTTVG